ncbi:MAG: BatD family protein, partial [Candidatus Fermentibacteraceae bacterium]|nr:BatD family protein [Candidatus Fermentibacteraceae bacterium]
ASAEVVDLFLEPADYATSRLSDDIEQLQWVREKDGVYRTWLATIDVTPAFACTLSLPVLRGRIGLPGGMIRSSREYVISSYGATIPVFPFPERSMPDNFTGITGELSFSSERITRGYSAGGERCIRVTARGPGSTRLEQLPRLTVSGPAQVRPGRCATAQNGERSWFVLVEPSDSGSVVVGPDSLAWFDTESETYRQAVIPPCTLSVYPISLTDADLSFLEDDGGNSALFWIMTVSIMLLASIFLILRYRSRVCVPADVMDAVDVEELLTALGDRLSVLLTGSRCYMGSEELDEILDRSSVDVILSRRLLRHWKDLELLLSGRTVSQDQLSRLKNKSRELLGEVSAELKRVDPR